MVIPIIDSPMPDFVKEHLKKNGNLWIILIFALIFFLVPKEYKLLVGGLFFVYLGIYEIYLSRIRESNWIWIRLGGFGGLFAGLSVLIFFFSNNLDYLVLGILSGALVLFLVSYFLRGKNWVKIVLSIVSGYVLYHVLLTINEVISLVDRKGMDTITYIGAIEIILIALILIAIIVRSLISILDEYNSKIKIQNNNHYLIFSLSIMFFILLSGFFIIDSLEKENHLFVFLGIISWAFFSSFVSVAAIKQILESPNHTPSDNTQT